jgi:hypothetical protein
VADSPITAQFDAASVEREALVRQTLISLVEKYGRGIYDEPARCEAMLRDLCPECRREVFLAVAALKERVVSDLVLFAGATPDTVLIARNSRKLQDSLGLSETSARWAVESWLPSAQVLAALPPPSIRLPAPALPDDLYPPDGDLTRRRVDWRWLGLCSAAILCSSLAIAAIGYCALYHGWQSFLEWGIESALFAGALALSAFGLAEVGRRLALFPAPQHQALDPDRTAAALLVEVAALLLLPLVPAGGVALWTGEWVAALHFAGRGHDLAFHLGRILQSLMLLYFLYRWVRAMVGVQGAIAVSMVRCR